MDVMSTVYTRHVELLLPMYVCAAAIWQQGLTVCVGHRVNKLVTSISKLEM